MQTQLATTDTERYARCIEASKRIRWRIDEDVIRGRVFDYSQKFLPDGLSGVDRLDFLSGTEKRFLSQIQGRTYANIFRLVERYIGAKMLDISSAHWLGDQKALESLVRFADEELKHQELFSRIERLCAQGMPDGYRFLPEPNEVATAVLGKSSWAALALTCHIELFTQVHYEQSIAPEPDLSPLFRDVFFYHWREESQHAVIDEIEWRREDRKLDATQRDHAVDDFIDLLTSVDSVLQIQSVADAEYYVESAGRQFTEREQTRVRSHFLAAYRWQYILSGAEHPRFQRILKELTTIEQFQRILQVLGPLNQRLH